jgi:hypothetical protein
MDLEVVREQWEMQGAAPAGTDAALAQVRHAVSLVAGAARAALGDAGASLEWLPETRAFATAALAGGKRAALSPSPLRLLVTDAAGEPTAQLDLAGKTLAEARQWLAAQLGLGEIAAPYPLPPSGVASGGAFDADVAALEDVARSYANASRALRCARDLAKSSEPVRVAPEALHVVCGASFGAGKSVGLGFAPGDAEIAESYFYGKPCPLPSYDADALPELEGGGEWKTDGAWFGGVLRRAEWTWYDAEQLQAGAAVSFLDSCVDAARSLLEG